MIELIKCPVCSDRYIDSTASILVCEDCKEPFKIIEAVNAVATAVRDVDQRDFNQFNSQHRTVLRGAITRLEAILNVLEKYPKQ